MHLGAIAIFFFLQIQVLLHCFMFIPCFQNNFQKHRIVSNLKGKVGGRGNGELSCFYDENKISKSSLFCVFYPNSPRVFFFNIQIPLSKTGIKLLAPFNSEAKLSLSLVVVFPPRDLSPSSTVLNMNK